MHVCTHACMYVRVHAYTPSTNIAYAYIRVRVHACACIHAKHCLWMHVCMHARTHACTHARMHARTYMHTQTLSIYMSSLIMSSLSVFFSVIVSPWSGEHGRGAPGPFDSSVFARGADGRCLWRPSKQYLHGCVLTNAHCDEETQIPIHDLSKPTHQRALRRRNADSKSRLVNSKS